MKVGHPSKAKTDIGALVSKGHLEKVKSYINNAEAYGGTLVFGGKEVKVKGFEEGYYLEPTIIEVKDNGCILNQEEIFGPVLSCIRVANSAEGIELINKHRYGNGVSVFTSDGDTAREFSHQIQVGMVGVNVPIPVPMAWHGFGGWKQSLFGDLHAFGNEAVQFYTKQKSVMQRWPDSISKGAEFVIPHTK